MTQEKIKFIKFENTPEWNSLEINQKWSQWNINSCGDGDVEIECCADNNNVHLFLNQDELKQVIEFLQSKVIK